MTTAGVGKIPPGDPQPAFPSLFKRTNFPRMISQPSPRRRGKTPEKAKQAQRFRTTSYKCPLSEKGRRRRAEQNYNNGQAACFYQKKIFSDEPPPESASKLSSAHFPEKISCFALPDKLTQREACRCFLDIIFWSRWRPFFLGNT